MAKTSKVLIVCADRDNDLGRKADVKGPIIGREKNLEAAAKLAVADPGESDANAMFAAVKAYDEVKRKYPKVEVVTLTGHGKFGLEADRRINDQLDAVLKKFPADGFILVTDGAEDDQILPILQSRGKLISKQMVIIKQAKEIESTYYTIKEALKDPTLALIVFGIPGIIMLLIAAQPSVGLQVAIGGIGAFLIIYGFGIYDRAMRVIRSVTSAISVQRTSLPFYLAVIMLFIFGLYATYSAFVFAEPSIDLLTRTVDAITQLINFTLLAGIAFVLAKSIDVIHLRKAYHLRRYFLSAVYILVIWLVIDGGRRVFVGEADLNLFLLTIISSFVVALIGYRISFVFDVKNRITRLLIGLPVYDANGKWMGRVENIAPSRNEIEYMNIENRQVKLKKREFIFREGRVLLSG